MREKIWELLERKELAYVQQALLLNESFDEPLLSREEIIAYFARKFRKNIELNLFLMDYFEGKGFEHIEKLMFSGAHIESLPDSIGSLSSLKSLACTKTSLASLPESIGMLKKLGVLKLESRLLYFLPNSIGDLESLEWFL